jgi:hypothetical protein
MINQLIPQWLNWIELDEQEHVPLRQPLLYISLDIMGFPLKSPLKTNSVKSHVIRGIFFPTLPPCVTTGRTQAALN